MTVQQETILAERSKCVHYKRLIAMAVCAALVISALSISGGTVSVQAADISDPRVVTDEDGSTTVTWDKVRLGTYKQDATFDETQKIKWRILDYNESSGEALLLADTILDCQPYNETYVGVTWETSTIRKWLNSDEDGFYNTAFTSDEQSAIIESDVVNEDNPEYETEGGNDTTDKVFLLSISEVQNASYGFSASTSSSIRYSSTRYAKVSDYAVVNGAYKYNFSKKVAYYGCGYWWLRSPGNSASGAMGGLNILLLEGSNVDNADGVRPALRVDLSKISLTKSGEVTVTKDGFADESDEGEDTGADSASETDTEPESSPETDIEPGETSNADTGSGSASGSDTGSESASGSDTESDGKLSSSVPLTINLVRYYRAPTIKASATKVKKGKSTTIKLTSDSKSKLTIKPVNKLSKKTAYVKTVNGKIAKLKFTKKAKKGKYKFKVTCPANGSYKKLTKTITITVK